MLAPSLWASDDLMRPFAIKNLNPFIGMLWDIGYTSADRSGPESIFYRCYIRCR